MNFPLGLLVLALIWAAITATFSLSNLVLGFFIGLAALWLVRERVAGPHPLRRLVRIFRLALLFLYELLLSAVRVALLVLSPNLKAQLKPAIIAFPLKVQSDVEITLLANLITLTPGTLSVDVSEDRKHIFVHCISAPDKEEVISSIATGFEAKIMEAFE